MEETLPFLQRLGLDGDADARAIRRAYARALKLIDQETDGAGFQQLREAYDTALQWAAWRERQQEQQQAAPAPAPPPAPELAAGPAPAVPNYGMPRTPVRAATPEPAPAAPAIRIDEPQQLAQAVFDEFRAAIAALLRQQHVQNPAQWQLALQNSLNDDRLLNITACIYFEAHIAQLLASGWQAGHEILFVVAGKVFHWGEDRRRLQQLGRAGALIDKAIDERTIFDRLPESELMIHRAAIQLLRKDGAPTAYQLRNDMPYVEKLMAYFPVWMSMIVDLRVVEQWRASLRALPPPKKSWWPKLKLGIKPGMAWVLAVVVLQLVRAAFNHNGDSAANYTPPVRAYAPVNSMAEFTPLPAPQVQRIKQHMPAVPFRLNPGLQAEFTVTLDESGHIYQQMLYRTSNNTGYDEAAAQALRASQPFPAETPRNFQVTFTAPTGSSQ